MRIKGILYSACVTSDRMFSPRGEEILGFERIKVTGSKLRWHRNA